MSEIEVVDWISDAESEGKEVAIGGMGGFFDNGMRWKDYLSVIDLKWHPYAEAIRRDVVKRGITMTGYAHQYDSDGVPVFSDGKIGSFSFRAWGDIMAAIWAEEKNQDYNYMCFYM